MKKQRKPHSLPQDTPATRKQRLQQRLKELSDKSEQELAAVMKSIEKVKDTFHGDKPSNHR